jgi:hypothetical protein
MKLPSVEFLLNGLVSTARRFPLALLFTVAATAIGIYLIQTEFKETHIDFYAKILMTCSLGLPLFFALHMVTEKKEQSLIATMLWFIAGIVLLSVFYFTTHLGNNMPLKFMYRYGLWNISFHLVVAFSAFSHYNSLNGFWQYNKLLFIRILTAGLYSFVLFVGLAGAMLAVQELFNMSINAKRYGQLFVLISGLFNTLFFLSGIPKNITALQEATDYPKGLKIFTQYVLLPLVTVYLVILYAYSIKIAVAADLPKGWVSNLILAFSVAGIFSLLLIHPIRNLAENKWINIFSKVYYFSLLPMIVLLFIAIGRRINDYGITTERYMVASLGVWLAAITLYFIVAKKKNIILIPVSLAVMFFFTSFGPWGAFKVSERNQIKRLEKLLLQYEVLENNKAVKITEANEKKLKTKDANQINSVLNYLAENHSLEGIEHWFNEDSSHLFKTGAERYKSINYIEKTIGIYADNYFRYDTEGEMNFSFGSNHKENGLDIAGYNRLYDFYTYSSVGFKDDKENFSAELKQDDLLFKLNDRLLTKINLKNFCASLKKEKQTDNYYYLPKEAMSLAVDSLQIKILFNRIEFTETDSAIEIKNVDGMLLLKDN